MDTQYEGGYWIGSDGGGDNILDICFALFVLEKIAPPPMVEISIEVKPCSWPNPLNKDAEGVFAVAICGTEDFDVTKRAHMLHPCGGP